MSVILLKIKNLTEEAIFPTALLGKFICSSGQGQQGFDHRALGEPER
jgi:hypothetical protein